MKQITKEDLNIPESLHNWFISHGWFDDYWMELPLNWQQWSEKDLSKYPITSEIVQWKKDTQK